MHINKTSILAQLTLIVRECNKTAAKVFGQRIIPQNWKPEIIRTLIGQICPVCSKQKHLPFTNKGPL